MIWELLVWEDGYFYKPISYSVDGGEKAIDSLLTINCRTTDAKWISSAILLCRNQRQINEEIVEKYRNIRYLDRKDQSMNASMFSSFFYLISESYSSINLEHRLVLLMHICDGFAIKYCNGSSSNNSGNINIILRKIDAKKYKYGAALLGISSSRAIDALGDTRNELTHYIYKSGSLGSFINNPGTETENKNTFHLPRQNQYFCLKCLKIKDSWGWGMRFVPLLYPYFIRVPRKARFC